MRHKVSAAAFFALLLSLTIAAEASAEGTLAKVRSFFKGRTRSTITGTVDRESDATVFRAEDGKTYTLDGRQAERLVEQHRGATVRITGYAQNERFEVRRFALVEEARVADHEPAAEETGDEEQAREIEAAELEEPAEEPAAPVRRRPGRRAAAVDDDSYAEDGSDSGEARTYTIERGDTLAGISKKFYGTTKHWGTIQKHNNIKDVKLIKPGMVLEIPAL